jgi:hypothetical protein
MADLTPSDLFHYIHSYRVLICRPCQYAIQPQGISRHLKSLHNIHRSSRRPFIEYASNLDLADPQDVILPAACSLPLNLLPIEDGLACNFCGCLHLCVTEKRMKSHWVTVHQQQGEGGTSWRSAKLQTLFRGNRLAYFEVSQATTSDSTKTLLHGDNQIELPPDECEVSVY